MKLPADLTLSTITQLYSPPKEHNQVATNAYVKSFIDYCPGILRNVLYGSKPARELSEGTKDDIPKVIRELAVNYPNAPTNLLICGKPRTHKTLLACTLCLHVMQTKTCSGYYMELIDYKDQRTIDRATLAGCLVLDEVVLDYNYPDWQLETANRLLSRRAREGLPTIIVASATPAFVAQKLGKALIDRLVTAQQTLELISDSS